MLWGRPDDRRIPPRCLACRGVGFDLGLGKPIITGHTQ